MTIENALHLAKDSSFHKCSGGTGTTIGLKNLKSLLKSISLYTDYNNCDSDNLTAAVFFDKATPGFQRENNKWSEKMRIKFVENVLKQLIRFLNF